MGGRDRHEAHRAATPLELLFDLTFVVSLRARRLPARARAGGGPLSRAGLLGFGFASFGICWAWTNFSWFASAYDTDDWIFRIATMVQMIGVLVLALGLPRMFASIEHGEHLDNSIMVLGYVDHARRPGVSVAARGTTGSAPGAVRASPTPSSSRSPRSGGWR